MYNSVLIVENHSNPKAHNSRGFLVSLTSQLFGEVGCSLCF